MVENIHDNSVVENPGTMQDFMLIGKNHANRMAENIHDTSMVEFKRNLSDVRIVNHCFMQIKCQLWLL